MRSLFPPLNITSHQILTFLVLFLCIMYKQLVLPKWLLLFISYFFQETINSTWIVQCRTQFYFFSAHALNNLSFHLAHHYIDLTTINLQTLLAKACFYFRNFLTSIISSLITQIIHMENFVQQFFF